MNEKSELCVCHVYISVKEGVERQKLAFKCNKTYRMMGDVKGETKEHGVGRFGGLEAF